MALSPMYAAILQDLNRAVAISQPEDVLQFCANWVSSPRVGVRSPVPRDKCCAVRACNSDGWLTAHALFPVQC